MSVLDKIPGDVLTIKNQEERRSAFMTFLANRITMRTPSWPQLLYSEPQFSTEELFEVKELLFPDTNNDWKNELHKEITIFKEPLRFRDGIFKIWKKEFDMNDENYMREQKDAFEKMDEKYRETNESKFFIALRTLLTIIIVWEENNDKKEIIFDIKSKKFKEKYNDLWILFHMFGTKNIEKYSPSYLTTARHLLEFCKSKLDIPHILRWKLGILTSKK